jgi:DNA-directed RNA polymerase beta' subunit
MNTSMFIVTEINVVGDLLCPLKVLGVLKRISDEDCQLLGLNPKYARPDWLILQVLPIPPPPVRPSVMMDTSSRSEASVSIHCFTYSPFSQALLFFHFIIF